MKSSLSFCMLAICFACVVLAHESQAKKGCNAYGHACYGGHGKRSLGSLMGGGGGGSNGAGVVGMVEPVEQAEQQQQQQQQLQLQHPDTILQLFPNEAASILADADMDVAYPKYRLIKIMKSWFNGHPRRPSERINEIDYPISGEAYNHETSNNFN